MLIAGIETSCDETGVGIVSGRRILASVVATQEDIHGAYGGVVPELASRAHCERIDRVFQSAMGKAGCCPTDLSAVAVTAEPGLKGALLTGAAFAAGLSYALDVPLYPVNHLHAHLAPGFIYRKAQFPCVGLVVSGGHTSLFLLSSPLEIREVGRTRDDACGETFDKVARMLGLSYPGGPAIEALAANGNPSAVKFPVALLGANSLDFSFSGLKTAVLYYLARHPNASPADICASFQKAAGEILAEKMRRAVVRFKPRSCIAGGGVVCNRYLARRLEACLRPLGVPLIIPARHLCLDNGAMVALFASFLIRGKVPAPDRAISVLPTARQKRPAHARPDLR